MMAFAAAHRGLSAEYPENTMAVFRAAANAGFPCIELDVRLTADGEVVVLHDAGIDRTTDGNGRVADMSYDELRGYETGEGPIPRLDDVFTELHEWHGHWNIEVKAWQATRAALDLCRHHDIIGRMQLSSLDPRALAAAHKHDPEVPRGMIVLGPPDDMDVEEALTLECDWINIDHDYADRALVERLRGHGLRVGAWTVNEPERALELAGWGVGSVITDTTDVLAVIDGPASE